ncbi:hypothetical protein AGMMS50239_14400 [Bacteroidia bacterium]|nr:hypothetical protein AGMMS50239_14400 [Bacteroidia bacterium]
MIRTVFTPNSNMVILSIPDNYIGTELEITIFPLVEIHANKPKKKANATIDASFGAWADMEKSDEEICTEIRSSRKFRKRDISL